ncbi:MAG: hypothetical protein M0021_09740 [Clostridia bacterium]|nr:hypothetical protein [Clostridia bacterium]
MGLLTPTQQLVDYILGLLCGLYIITRKNYRDLLPDVVLLFSDNKAVIALLVTYIGGYFMIPWIFYHTFRGRKED